MHQSKDVVQDLNELRLPYRKNFRLSEIPLLPGVGDINKLLQLRARPDSIALDSETHLRNREFVEHPVFFRYAKTISNRHSIHRLEGPPLLFESGLGSSNLSLILASEQLRALGEQHGFYCEYKTLAGCRGDFRSFRHSSIDRRTTITQRWLQRTLDTFGAPNFVSYSGSSCGTLEAIERVSTMSTPAVRSLTLLSPLLFMHSGYANQVNYALPTLNVLNWTLEQLKQARFIQTNKEWREFAPTRNYAKNETHIIDPVEYLDVTYSRIPDPVLTQMPEACRRARIALQNIMKRRLLAPNQIIAVFGDRQLETALDVAQSIRFLEGLGIRCVEFKDARHRPHLTHCLAVERAMIAHIKKTS